MIRVVKVAVVGSRGSGKSEWINSLSNSAFRDEYFPSEPGFKKSLTARFSSGTTGEIVRIKFELSEISQRNGAIIGRREVIDNSAMVILCDKSLDGSVDDARFWLDFPMRVPKVVCDTKYDVLGPENDRSFPPSSSNGNYCFTSAKNGLNVAVPLLMVAREILEDRLLTI